MDSQQYGVFKICSFFEDMSSEQFEKGNHEMSIYYSNKAEGVKAVIRAFDWESEYEYFRS